MKCVTLVLFIIAGWAEVLAQSACTDNRFSTIDYFDASQIDTLADVVYGQAVQFFNGQTVELQMDVFMPSFEVDDWLQRPAVLLIHGGGFMAGNKSEMHYECHELAKRGFVAITMDYRLGWNCDNALCVNCYGANLQKAVYHAVQDARAALRFMLSQADVWRIDTNRIFIGGESAGSITALMATHWCQSEADAWLPVGYANQAGGLDSSGNSLTDFPVIRGVINHCGAVTAPTIIQSDSAIPMISFHDNNDCVVPFQSGPLISCFCSGFLNFSGSNALHSYYLSNNWCSELHVVPQILPNHCQFPAPNLVQLAACFMKRAMCGFCMSSQNSDIYVQAQCNGAAISTESIGGCTYSQASNYAPDATFDDGSCVFSTCAADLNTDGLITVADLLLLIDAYGGVCPP